MSVSEARRPPPGVKWRREVLDEKGEERRDLFARSCVITAYVFGSLARGRDPDLVTDDSDLDLAVLLPGSLTTEQRWRRGLTIERVLLDILGRAGIDLVVANDAPVVLRNRITRERDVVYGRDARGRVLDVLDRLRRQEDRPE